jgi:hypothetical protein
MHRASAALLIAAFAMKSIDATQRTLFICIALATLLTLGILAADLSRGGQPDPPSLRAAATLLDGEWRFHTGDDARWADANTDDRAWQSIDLTAQPGSHDGDVGLPDYVDGWMAHGHPGYTGYAWYRRVVNVPAGNAAYDILGPPLVEDGYELYWNGRLLGGSGRLGAHPRVVSTRPMRFALPADAAGTSGALAIRVFELTRAQAGTTGGGMHVPPMLAPRPVADGLHSAQWARTIAGYVVDAIEPVAMFLVVGLALWCWPRSDRKSFLIFLGIALLLTGARRLNNALVSWTDVLDLPTYSFLAKFMWMPTVAAFALAWNRWLPRAWRSIDVAALLIMVAQIAGTALHAASVTSVSRWASIALFVIIGARIVRGGTMRILALINLVLIIVAFFGDELLDPIGVPGIWFPFGIGVSRTQYLYALLIPLLAVLIVRTLSSKESASRSNSAKLAT